MAIDTTNPILQKLFQSPQAGVNANAFITKGNLIMFRYNFWMHDPMPLIIITDYNPGNRIRGINLHYLTYGHISTLLTTASTNPSFSYQNIRGDSYITNAFRSYKWQGIAQVKKFDSQFILQMMAVARTFDPNQVKAIRQAVDEQIQREVATPANQMVGTEVQG